MAYYSKLSPSDAGSIGSQPNFGEEVGIGNGKVAVGAPLADDGSTLNRGAVYVYDLDGSNETKISPTAYSNVALQFGQNVSIGSNKILVGSGADLCFLYDLDGTNEVVIDPGYSNSNFGFDKQGIAIYGDKFYISDSNLASNTRLQVGAVYIYRLSDQALLKVVRPSDANDPNSLTTGFGYSIDVKDNILVVGCPTSGDDGSVGKVFVYDLDGNNERIIEASDGVTGDYLGWKVGIDSGRIIASARLWHPSRDGETSGAGAAYSWKYDGSDERVFRQKNVYNSNEAGDAFSEDSLVAGGGRVYIGARYFENGGRQGSVFSFTLKGNAEYNFLSSDSNASSGDHYSYAMDYDEENGYLVVTALYADSVVGAAYVYEVAAPSGNIRNLSSSSYTGTINGPTFNSAGYLETDGISDNITIPGLTLSGSGGFTVELWIKLTGLQSDTGWNYFLRDEDGLTPPQYEIGVYNNNNYSFIFKQNSISESVTTVLTQNQWHHICFGVNASQQVGFIYRDGVFAGGSTNSFSTGVIPLNKILGNFATSTGLAGQFGEIRGYDRELTSTEVSQNFNATRSKYGV